jgi:hypothetical protein
MGVLILFSGGRLLRLRPFTDLMLIAGGGAAFAPLFGLLYLRLYACFADGLSAADATMRGFMLSVESVLMIGICICALLPAIAALRREAAISRGSLVHVPLPFCLVGGRHFGRVRLISLLALALATVAGLAQLVLSILPVGPLLYFDAVWEVILHDSKAVAAALPAVKENFAALSAPLMRLAFVLMSPLILLSLLLVLPCFWSVLWAKKQTLCDKKRKCRSIRCVGVRLRAIYLMPFWLYTVAQVFLSVVLLFGSKLLLRVDMSDVEGALSLIYMVIGYVRGLGGVNTLYVLVAVCGALLWHAANALSCRLIDLSCREHNGG